MEIEKATFGKNLIAAVAVFALAAVLGLAGCSSGSSSVSNETKTDAKTVIKAASNVFAVTQSLNLTEKDSPATITQSDSKYAAFFDELEQYKTMSGVSLEDCSFTVTVQSVTANTARGDSTQTNYRYAITKASMKVNGKQISYDVNTGFNSK